MFSARLLWRSRDWAHYGVEFGKNFTQDGVALNSNDEVSKSYILHITNTISLDAHTYTRQVGCVAQS